MKTRGKTAVMAKSAKAQSHSTYDPAVDMVAPPPLITTPPTRPAAGSSNLRGTATEHGGTSHEGGLVTTTDLGPVLEKLQAFLLLPSCSTHAPAYTSNETLARVQLGSTHFSHPDPRSQADLNLRRRMDERTDRQLNRYPAGRAGVGKRGEGQQLDRPTDMSQASASPTQSRLSLRNNVRERLGPRLDIQTRLGPQGSVLQRLGP
ncbi:unnamed protein product [Prunus brigantina]